MDHQRLQVVLIAQPFDFVALRPGEFVLGPLTRAGRKHLKCIAPQTVGALGGILYSAGAGGMNADTPRSQAGRAFGLWPCENILLTGDGTMRTGHKNSISRAVM